MSDKDSAQAVLLGPADRIAERIRRDLAELERFFVPEARLTFIVRVPGQPGAEMVITKDTMGGGWRKSSNGFVTGGPPPPRPAMSEPGCMCGFRLGAFTGALVVVVARIVWRLLTEGT